jgi:hypothetical protein
MQAHFPLLGRKNLKTVIIITAGIAAIWYFPRLRFVSGDLINNLWTPAHLLVRGQSPYLTHILQIEGVTWLAAVWLPMAIGLFFPLGWLTPIQATQLWLVSNIALLIAIAWLAQGASRPRLVVFAASILSVFIYPPTWSHLWLGQFTILATFLLLLAARFVAAPRYLLVGFLVVVSLAKPQLSVLVVPGLFIVYGRDHGLGGILSFTGALVLWIMLLTLPLWVAHPLWLSDFVAAQGQNPKWAHPSFFALLPVLWGTIGLVLWGISALGIFVVNVQLWLKRPPQNAVIWSLALTPLVTPYIWSWDFVILLPLIVYAIARVECTTSRIVVGLGYLMSWGLMVWIRICTDHSDERYWWVPWLTVAFVGVGCLMDARASAKPNRATN